MKVSLAKTKTYLDEMDWTQKDLARVIGVHEVTMSKKFSGKELPSLQQLYRISNALQVKLEDLFDIIEE